jgi:hypothetical protein
MKKMIVCALAGIMILGTSSCTGPFKLTKQVHSWHTGMEDRWVQEIAFLGVVIIPVYFVTTLGDAIIFNSIEFWGGENPIADISTTDDNVKMVYNEDGSILIKNDQGAFILKKSNAGVKAFDTNGNILYTSKTGADNKVRVYNADGKVVQTFNKS